MAESELVEKRPMSDRNIIIALFVMVVVLALFNIYQMYQVDMAVKMIGLLSEHLQK